MNGIIDIHSHILPGLDDGAESIEESIKMLQLAKCQGISEVIATPHYSGTFDNACPDRIRELCRAVQARVREKMETVIRILPGQEIMYSQETVDMLEDGRLLTMAGSRYVLIEFHPSAPYSYIFQAVRQLTIAGYQPVLAHVERYPSLREDGRIDEIKQQGAYVQINFHPIGGKWYNSTTRWCRAMLREEKADFVATDMHNAGSRRPETEQAVKWMERILDRGYTERVLKGNALKILSDRKA